MLAIRSEQVSDVRIRGSVRSGPVRISVDRFLEILRLTETLFGIEVRFRQFGRWVGWKAPWGSSTY
jgi:hypothetical protein